MSHQSVLLEPALRALQVRAEGIYVDATFGRGGHSVAILQQLNDVGRLYAIDRDIEAVQWGERTVTDHRFSIRHGAFDCLSEFCEDWGVRGKVDGLIFDLGVSSPQLDDAHRGFSFMREGPLDMRMDTTKGLSAAQWLAAASEQEIADVIWKYGEERNSRKIARKIIEMQSLEPIVTTKQLAELVCSATPRKEQHKHPATRTFQAIRIFLNSELQMLETVLSQVSGVLAVGGRLVTISFHSLEDRIVKRFLRYQGFSQEMVPRGLPVMDSRNELPLHVIGKPIKSDEGEVRGNVRARSAIMRVAERVL